MAGRHHLGAREWFERHCQTILIMNAVCIALLLLMHVFATTVPFGSQ